MRMSVHMALNGGGGGRGGDGGGGGGGKGEGDGDYIPIATLSPPE